MIERRNDDERINEILEKVRSTDQTIRDVIKPKLDNYSITLYGKDGEGGLKKTVDVLHDRVDRFPWIVGIIFTAISSTATLILWVKENGSSFLDGSK